MKKNMKRWLALLLAVCMVATSAVYTNGTSLKATGEESSEGVDAGTPAPASETGEGTAAPTENTTQEEIPIEPQQPAPAEEPAAEPEPSPAPETNDTPAADTPAVEEPQTPAAEAPEETPAEKKYNVALNKPASDGGEIASWTAADKSDKKKVSYDGNGQYKLEVKEGAGFWFEITTDDNHEVEKVTDQNGNTVAPKMVDGKVSTYEILNITAEKAFTVVYKEVVQEEGTPEVNEPVKNTFEVVIEKPDIDGGAVQTWVNDGIKKDISFKETDQSGETVDEGAAFHFAITVNDNFEIEKVTVNNNEIAAEKVNENTYTYKVENVAEDKFITVRYKETSNGDAAGKEDEISVIPYSRMTEESAQAVIPAVIHYTDDKGKTDEDIFIAAGNPDDNAPEREGYQYVNATVSGTVVTYIAKIGEHYYYGTPESIKDGVAVLLGEDEKLILNYKTKLETYKVTFNITDTGTGDNELVEPASNSMEVEEGQTTSFQVKVMSGNIAAITGGGIQESGITVPANTPYIEKTFTTVPITEDTDIHIIFTSTGKHNFKFSNPNSGNWHSGAITYNRGENLKGSGNLLYQGASFDNNEDISFTMQTSLNNGGKGNWGYWQLNGLAINGQGLNIPQNKTSADKGQSATTRLENGSLVTIRVIGAEDKNNSDYRYVLFTYEVTVTNAREDIAVTSGNFHNVFWPEILIRKADGIKANTIQTLNGNIKYTIGIPVAQSGAQNIKFQLKPGYESPEVFIDDEKVAVAGPDAQGYYQFRVDYKGSPNSNHAYNNQNFGERKVEIEASKINYSVVYQDTDGQEISGCKTPGTYDVLTNTEFVLTNTKPGKVGYQFKGWKLGDKTFTPGTIIKVEEVADEAREHQLIFTALWEKIEEREQGYVTVHCYDEDNDELLGGKEGVTYGPFSLSSTVTIIGDYIPSFDGYAFHPENNKNVRTAVPTKDGKGTGVIKLYYSKEYHITYENTKDADISKLPATYTKSSETFTIPEISTENYIFTGWTQNRNDKLEETVTIEKGSTGDIKLTANWKEKKKDIHYTVEYYKYENSIEDAKKANSDTITKEVWTGGDLMLEVQPVDKTKYDKDGYHFDESATGSLPEKVKDGGTVKIYYKANTATVSVWFYKTVESGDTYPYYITKGGTLSREENGDNKYLKQISTEDKSGYSEADIRKYAEEAYGLTEEIDRYETFEIYVLHKGASAWDTEPIDLDTYIIQDGDNIRYHVVPEAAHKVSYTAGTNSSGSSEDGYYYKSDEIAVKDIENTGVKPDKGFKFDHWEPTSGSIVEGKYIMGDKDVEIQAICVKDETKWHNISYLPGTEDVVKGMPEDETDVLEGSVQYVSPVVPTRFGYLFEGWKPVTESIVVRDNQFTMPAEDVVFEAQWKADQSKWHEIIYRSGTTDSVTGMPENEKMVLEGTEKTVSKAVPQRFGYTFKEWKLLTSEVDVNDSKFIMPSQNVEFEAQWEVDSSKWHNISYLPGTTDTVEKLPQGENSVLEGTEKNISKLEPIRMGYTFGGWEVSPKTLEIKDSKFIMPQEDVVFTAQWVPNTNTKYIVRHFLQNVGDDEYTEDIDAVQELKGTTHELTEVEAKEYTGFTAKEFEQVEIAPDGSTEIKIYYDRNKYNITYQITGDYFVNNEYVKQTGVKYGASLSLIGNNMHEEGYVWSGWSELPGMMPAGDVTVTGSYRAAEDTKYTVKHFLQNVEDDEYTEDQGAVQELEGTTGKETKAEARTYEGFTVKAFEQKEIARDGSTVVEIYYDRNKYDITYKITGKYFEDEKYTEQTGVKYGAALKLITDDMSRVGYVWSNWSDLPKTMPAENVTVTGSYSAATDTIYTVRHFLQNVEDDEYTEDAKAAQELRGTTGEPTSAQIKNYPGFMVRPFHQDIIAANGSTVVKIYYDRNKYNITYQITGEYFEAEKYAEQTGVKYETPLSLIKDDMTKAGYVWSEWSELPKIMPAEDVTVTGSYSAAADTVYTVKHLLQNVADDGYTEDASEELKGTTHELTEAKAKEYAGFTAKAFAQAEIKPDGSTEVKIYYDRNKYDITYRITGEYFAAEKYAEQTGVKYGTPLSLITDDMAKAGYVWSKWSEFPETMPAENVTVTGSYRAAEDTKYTVKHLLQNVENDEYTEDTEAVQELKGTTHELTEAEAKEYTGFTAKAFAQAEIKPDGSTEVKIYYDRNKYDITYQITGEYFAAEKYAEQTEVKYETPLSLIKDDMTKAGYVWNEWSELPETMPAENITVTGSYNAAKDTNYTVRHFLQNVEDNEYTEDVEAVQKLKGTTHELTEAEAKEYTGFTAQAFKQAEIAPDGSTEVKIYYDRKKYNVTYQITGKYFADDLFEQQTGVKYGAPLSLIGNNMHEEGYVWSGWSELPGTMPAGDVTVTGSYRAAEDTKYTVKHFLQNIEDDEYTEDQGAVQELEGITGKETKAEARIYEGFTAKSFEQQKILRDGSTVVEIYYERNKYDITYKITGEYFAANPYKQQTEVKYRTPLSLIKDNMVKAGYIWSEWSELPETMPAENVTVIGSYSAADDTKYTVRHFLQNVADDEYTEDAEAIQELEGTTHELTEAKEKVYIGFTAKAFKQAEIQPDGSTEIKIYYDRNKYDITYQVTGEYFAAEKYAEQTEVKYETPLSLIKDDMTKAGYIWSEWSELPETMPAENVTVIGSYSAADDTKYTVRHFLQNVADDEYTEDAEAMQELEGTTHELTEAKEKVYIGFTAKAFRQAEIQPDGSTEVKIYYDRNKYDITYQITGEYFAAEKYAEQTEVKYGTPLSLITDDMAKAGYVWSEWSKLPETMPAQNVTVIGSYRAAEDTKYTVKHLLQNVEDDEYTEDNSEELKGTTHELTEAEAKEYTGFTAQAFKQAEIQPDGSTVVEIYYDRNKYSVTYQITGDYFANDQFEQQTGVKYGTKLSLIGNDMREEGYVWSGWSELPGTMPAEDVIVTGFYSASTETKYTVKHFKQNVEDDEYTEDAGALQELEGTTGKETEATANVYEGFTAKAFEQKTIARDGSTVVEIYYDRNKYDITYQITGEYFAAEKYAEQTEVKYGTPLSLIADEMAKAGYVWSEWSELPKTMPAKDVTVTGFYSAAEDTKYTVRHLLQNVADDEYTENTEAMQELEGTTHELTEAEAKVYTGFTAKAFSQVEIAPNGSTEVKIYYDRNKYNITYQITGKYFAAEKYAEQTGVKYETPLSLIKDDMTKAGYVWSEWSELPETMPAEDVTVTGSYSAAADTVYTVKHLLQNVADDGYTEDASEKLKGTTHELTEAEAKKYTGFTAKAFAQEEIKPDGSTEVKIYYDRNKYDITYQITGEYFAAEKYAEQTGVKYGTLLSLITDDMAKAGYVWSKWSELPGTMPAENVTVTGSYRAAEDTKYTVKHLLQNVENDEYTEDTEAVQELKGTTHELTEAEAKEYTGFIAKAFAQAEIKPDGSTEVKIYYDRNKYNVTYQITGEYFADDLFEQQTGVKYGAPLSLIGNNMHEEGYVWSGWSELPGTMPAGDVTVTGYYRASEDTKYTVKHFLQNVEDDEYTEDQGAVQELEGITGKETKAEARTYEGFTAKAFEQQKILRDGSTVVEIYYDRNKYDIIYQITGEYFDNVEYAKETGIKYGTMLSLIADNMLQEGYVWSGWAGLPQTMPDKEVNVLGYYTAAANTAYNIEYHYQNPDTGLYDISGAAAKREGTTNSTVSIETLDKVPQKDPAHYVFDETVEGTKLEGAVAADGSLTLHVYFALQYKVTGTIDQGSVTNNAQDIRYEKTSAEMSFDAAEGYIINSITVNGELQTVSNDQKKFVYPPQTGVKEDILVQVTTEPRNPEVTVTKYVLNPKPVGEEFTLGEDIEYQVVVENTGNIELRDIAVSDTLKDMENIKSLKPGEKQVYEYRYTVTEEDIKENHEVVNVAAADVPSEPGTGDEVTVITPTEDINKSLQITKEVTNAHADGTPFSLGEEIAYRVMVKNTGNVTLNNVQVEDSLVALEDSMIEELIPNEVKTFDYTYTVTEADINSENHVVANTAAASTPKDTEPDSPKHEDTIETPVDEPNPKTEVTKEVTSTPANGTAYALGEEISYKVTVKNTGNVTLENIQVTDSLVALEDSIIDSLAPGAEKEFTYSYTVTEADINSENHLVVNAAAAVVPDQPEAGGEDTVETPVDEPREGLDVVKTITSQTEEAYELGEVVTFNVRVTNTGNVTVNDVTVTDELVGAADVIPEIAPGEFVDLTYTYTITEADLETGVINVAVAATPGGTTGEGRVEVNTGDRNPGIDVTKEVTNTPANGEAFVLGETIQYKVTVVNNGNVTLENVTVDDSLVDLQGNTIASLAPGAKETFEYSYEVTEDDIKAGNVTNAVTAGGTGQGETEEPEEPKSEDEVVTPVEPENPSVEVNKTVTNTPANGTAYALGEAIDYSVIVKNTGNVTLTNITVEDSLVELTDHVIDSLAPGETREFTYSYIVTEDDIQNGYVRNAATADIPDGPNGNDEIETPTEEVNSNLAVEKSIVNPKEEYRIGDRIAYEIVVRNTGNTTLSNVRVTDHLQGAAGQVEFTELAGNTLDGNVVVIASMAPGEEVTLGCEYEVTREDTGNSISNIASVVSDETPDTPKEDGTEETPVEDFYTLTIHYVNTAGETVAPDYTGEFAFGDVFAVTSPAVAGYTPEYTAVNSGEAGMPAEDLEFTVIYTADPVVPPIDPTPDNPTPDNPTPDNPTPDNPAPVTPVTPPVTPATPTTPLTPPAPAAVTPGTTVTPPAATPTTTVEPQEAVIEQNEDGNYDLTPVPDEAVPLANKNLADHVCCILHFLIMLLAFIITAFYTRSMKKRQARIFELREELELETVKRQNDSVEDSRNSGRV